MVHGEKYSEKGERRLSIGITDERPISLVKKECRLLDGCVDHYVRADSGGPHNLIRKLNNRGVPIDRTLSEKMVIIPFGMTMIDGVPSVTNTDHRIHPFNSKTDGEEIEGYRLVTIGDYGVVIEVTNFQERMGDAVSHWTESGVTIDAIYEGNDLDKGMVCLRTAFDATVEFYKAHADTPYESQNTRDMVSRLRETIERDAV